MDRVSVAIRIRPLNAREASGGSSWIWDERTVTQCALTGRPVPNATYAFDQVFGPDATTAMVFQKVARDLVNSAMSGINGTIFAYGQTSSGKTHTMKGGPECPGVIPLAVQTLFQCIEAQPNREFLLRVAYMEIYNEMIADLLNPTSGKLAIREDPQRGMFVAELREQIVTSPEELLKAMDTGERNRHVGATNMNEKSSRSHTIFRITIESRDRGGAKEDSGPVKVSALHLVDLAGSERIRHTGAEGDRRKEGAAINKSLLNLGLVISKLSEGKGDREFVPYRNSKLTTILSSALGGNSRTAIVCNITPSAMHADESLSTLKFASQAKLIKTRPQVNEVATEQTLLRTYQRRVQQLEQEKKELEARAREAAAAPTAELAARLKEEESKRAELQEKLEKLQNVFVSAKSMGAAASDIAANKKAKRGGGRRETWAPVRGVEEEEPEADHAPPPARITAESLALPSHIAAMAMPAPAPAVAAPEEVKPHRSSSGGGKKSRAELEEENRTLSHDFDELERELMGTLEELEAVKKEKVAMQEEVAALQREKEEFSAEKLRLQDEAARLSAERDDATVTHAKELAELDQKLDELQVELDIASRTAVESTDRINAKEDEIAALKEKLNEVEVALEKARWDAEMNATSGTNNNDTAKQAFEAEARRAAEEREAIALKRAEKAEAELAELEAHLSEVRKERAEIETSQRAELEARNEQLEKTTALLDAANAEVQELNEKLEQTERALADQRTKSRRSEGGDSAAKRQVMQLQRELEEKEHALEVAQRQAATAEAERESTRSKARADREAAEDAERARQRAEAAERRTAEERDAALAARNKAETAAMEREESLREEVRKASAEAFKLARTVDAQIAAAEAEVAKARAAEEECAREAALRKSEALEAEKLRLALQAAKEVIEAKEAKEMKDRRATIMGRPGIAAAPIATGTDRDLERLKSKLEASESKLKQAILDRSEAQTEKGVIERELKDVKKKVSTLEIALEKTKSAEAKIKELNTALTAAQKKAEAAVKEAEAQAKAADKARVTQQQLETELAIRMEELAGLHSEMQLAQQDIKQRTEEIVRLQAELSLACRERDDLLRRRAELERSLSAVHEACSAQQRMKEESERHRHALEDEKRRLCEELTSVSYTAEQASTESKSRAVRANALETSLAEAHISIRTLQKGKEAAEEQLKQTAASLQHTIEKVQTAEARYAEAEARWRETDAKRTSAERDVATLTAEKKAIEAALTAELTTVQRNATAAAAEAERRAKENASQLEKLKRSMEDERRDMAERAEMLNENNARLSQEKAALAAQKRATDEERQAAMAESEVRAKEIAALKQELKGVVAGKERIQKSLDNLAAANEADRDGWQQQRRQLEAEVASLKEKLRIAIQRTEEAVSARGSAEQRGAKHGKEIAALQAEMHQTEARLLAERKSAESTQAQLEAEAKSLKVEANKLKEKLKAAEENAAAFSEAVAMAEDLSQKATEKDKHIKELEKKLQRGAAEWSAAKANLEAKLEQYRSQMTALEEANRRAAVNSDVAKELAEAQAKADELSEEVMELKLQLSEEKAKNAETARRAKARQSMGGSLLTTNMSINGPANVSMIAPAPGVVTGVTVQEKENIKGMMKTIAGSVAEAEALKAQTAQERRDLKMCIQDLGAKVEEKRLNLETLPKPSVPKDRAAIRRDIAEINRREREEREKENAKKAPV